MHRLIATTFIFSAIVLTPFSSHGNEPHPGPRSPEQAAFLFQEAQDASKNHNTELAIENYRKLLKTYPSFEKTLTVYEELMSILLSRKQMKDVVTLGSQVAHLHPKGDVYTSIQFLRAQAELSLDHADKAKLIAEEVLNSKPSSQDEAQAMLYKAEALSIMGKHQEAMKSLDEGRSHVLFSDAELKVRARACQSRKQQPKEEFLFHVQQKNLCFKESAALARTEPAQESAQVWCNQFKSFETALEKAKTDSFTREKLKKELALTKALSSTWGCR